MYKLLLILFLAISHTTFSQEIKGTVLDHSSQKAIPYASVYYSKVEVGTYTDSAGNFSIPKILGDTLVISAIGFEKRLVPAENNITTLNISLKPLTINLNEVVIMGNKYSGKKKGKTLSLGSFASKRDMIVSMNRGGTIAYLVKGEAGIKGQIKSIQYSVNPKFIQGKDVMVRAHLYTVDENTGKPGKDLLFDADVIKVREEDAKIVVDVAYLGVELPPEGVYVGLEWISLSPWYTLSYSTKPTAVYTKFMDRDWQLKPTQKKLSATSKNSKEKTQQDYYVAPNFGLTIVY